MNFGDGVGAEEYVRSARFIVRSLQLKALSALGVDPLLRSLGMDELVEHLRNQCGFCNEELVELRDKCAQCVQQFPFHSFAVPTCNQPAAGAGAGPCLKLHQRKSLTVQSLSSLQL